MTCHSFLATSTRHLSRCNFVFVGRCCCPRLSRMCRRRLRSPWLVFLGFVCILGSAECYLADEYDEDGENYLRQNADEESPESFSGVLISKREPAFTPYISIGALSNMQQFFENLKENFHSLESLSQEERKALLGKHEQSAEQETRIFRPPATAAYLHAVRNHRPSHKIRNFVANAEPPYLKGSNHYDPSYLWTGLGRRQFDESQLCYPTRTTLISPFLVHQERGPATPQGLLHGDLSDLLGRHPFSITKYEAYTVAEVSLPEGGPSRQEVAVTLPLTPSRVRLPLRRHSVAPQGGLPYLLRTEKATKVVGEDVLEMQKCFYSCDEGEIKALVDLCEGLNGIILVGTAVYAVKPLPPKYQKSNGNTAHLILRLSSNRALNGTSRPRRKRSFAPKKEVSVETAVFVDKDLYRHMLNNFPNSTERNLFRFVLAMINAVQLLYHDASLEVKVSFVLKRLEILYTDPPELQRSHDIDRYLSSFCSWQERENIPREKSPLHWDHALMLTGLDLYVIGKSGKLSNQVLGLAPVGGMCKPASSCTVNEGLHFESVYVVAHEIGHNLGMRHDGPSADNHCDPNSHIMSPTLGSGKSSWSSCSNLYLQKFLVTPQAQCLFETTYLELDHTEGGTFPGERFDSNLQCMLKYGKQSERSPTQRMEEICRDLRCTKERYTWTSHPALEGTKCGVNKWCRFGRCVKRGHVDISGRIADGGWSPWSPFSECASGCLHGNHPSETASTGIAFASRTCNNPRPENGGKQCLGPHKKYQTCEALQCSNVPPITVTEFAEQICRRAREVDKDLTGVGFQRNSSEPEEACTVWCYQYNGGAKTRGWTFPDGTRCHLKRASTQPTFCVSGTCEEFDCLAKKESAFAASGAHCQVKPVEPEWSPVGPCRYNCITPAVGLRVVKRGPEYNIELCRAECTKKKSLFEYATLLCNRYKERVKKLSGLGIQLSASSEDPDRPCHVACQDDSFSHRFYLVTGEDGWFPFGADCARGIHGKKAYCVSGRCLEFGKNNIPTVESELTFVSNRRRRSLEVGNKTVVATVDITAIRRVIELLSKGNRSFPHPAMISIDFDNPIHIKPDWEFDSEILTLKNITILK